MLHILRWLWRLLLGLLGVRREPAPPRQDHAVELMRAEFGNLALEALQKSQETFLNLAETRFKNLQQAGVSELDQKKVLIDQRLGEMKTELGKVSNLVQTLEKDREAKFGELTTNLKSIGEQAAALTSSTTTLREALSSSRTRGQWGERMAEDILRLMGFVEGVNYQKQAATQVGSRPDFTFLLPQDLKLNMDVKFPLDNHMRYLEAQSESDRSGYQKDFLRDVRAKIGEVSDRQYIDPEQDTVDCVLLFLPNESIYSFVHEADPSLIDLALQKKVIWCSPLTLYAVLAVVRQAVDNFTLKKTASEINSLMGSFNKQWGSFTGQMDTLGKRICSVQEQFNRLSETRRRALERPLNAIEQLRIQGRLPIAEMEGEVQELQGDEAEDSEEE